MTTPRIPVMPSRLEDVPAWLRYNASRLSFRVLFLADMLAEHLEHRQALEAVARETGIRLVDLPPGLTEAQRAAFIRDTLGPDLEALEATPAPAADDHDPRRCNEWNGYRVGHDRHEYVCPDWPHVLEAPQEAATAPLAAGAGRLMAEVLNTALQPAPTRCPHCGDRFRTAGELATHVRDTGDNAGRTRPGYACPVLWTARGGQ